MMTPLVSVLCLAYNHEAYIRQTLESFLMQKTDFPFEVIVHDDASTDGTAAIIREFEARYPEIIKPIYQTENQYSKPDTPIMKTFLYPQARGKYFAICDGDDQFTDPDKLQRQAGFLEANPDYSICVHRALLHREGTGPEEDTLYPPEEADRDYEREELMVRGAGLFATNSFLMRREVGETLPDAFFVSGVGDYPWLLYASLLGKCRYLAAPMCVHNEGVKGSWTADIWQDEKARLDHEAVMTDMLGRVDAHYEGRYHGEIEKAKAFRRQNLAEYRFETLRRSGRVQEAAEDESLRPLYRDYQKLRRRRALKKLFPFLSRLKRKGGAHE